MTTAADAVAADSSGPHEAFRRALHGYLHARLKAAFREFALTPDMIEARRQGWWPEPADMADLAVAVFREVVGDMLEDLVVDLRDDRGAT